MRFQKLSSHLRFFTRYVKFLRFYKRRLYRVIDVLIVDIVDYLAKIDFSFFEILILLILFHARLILLQVLLLAELNFYLDHGVFSSAHQSANSNSRVNAKHALHCN